ncbi:DUF3052 domain-containing protein [Subtercola endophyticus]|uniref:DUF3052 domain-containing protein n=1 Tax=Subtercola endophyticus TaxID=2895559 RepID=UPI001E316083|nr:DUF3052 domain-containing protein [Subtercola endophyticus]UFS59703.1 DUF3052 domain-containing protein [Subtercola endophyticus]
MTQAQKLGLKPGLRVCLDQAPGGWMLDTPPAGLVEVSAAEPADIIVAFVRRAAELSPRIPSLARRVFPAGALWIAWPRKAGGHVSDLGDAVVRGAALEFGLVDVKVAALDTDWSALKFVWRVENRGVGAAPTAPGEKRS